MNPNAETTHPEPRQGTRDNPETNPETKLPSSTKTKPSPHPEMKPNASDPDRTRARDKGWGGSEAPTTSPETSPSTSSETSPGEVVGGDLFRRLGEVVVRLESLAPEADRLRNETERLQALLSAARVDTVPRSDLVEAERWRDKLYETSSDLARSLDEVRAALAREVERSADLARRLAVASEFQARVEVGAALCGSSPVSLAVLDEARTLAHDLLAGATVVKGDGYCQYTFSRDQGRPLVELVGLAVGLAQRVLRL